MSNVALNGAIFTRVVQHCSVPCLLVTHNPSRALLCFAPVFAMQAHAIQSELGSRLPPAVPGVAQSTAMFKGVFRQNGPEALAGHRCAWHQPLLYACLRAGSASTDNRMGTDNDISSSTRNGTVV